MHQASSHNIKQSDVSWIKKKSPKRVCGHRYPRSAPNSVASRSKFTFFDHSLSYRLSVSEIRAQYHKQRGKDVVKSRHNLLFSF